MQIIIVAGGGGTRLWPVSTKKSPKQFVPLLDNKTLLQHTVEMALTVTTLENIWISTNAVYRDLILSTVIGFDPNHLILEPEKRDSFPAVAAAAALVSHKTSTNEPLIFVPCDDWLNDTNSILTFAAAQKRIAVEIESQKYLLMVAGVKPTFANTNYGYIQIKTEDKYRVFEQSVPVVSFKEKPNPELAEQFFESGDYLWNKFNFAFSYSSFCEILAPLDPDSVKVLAHIQTEGLTRELFGQLPKISFDFHVLDRVKTGLGVMGMDIRWDDLGNWDTIEKYLPSIEKTAQSIQIDGLNNKAKLADPSKKIAFVGVSDILVVETDDGLMICDVRNIQNIKSVAEHFDN